MKKVLLALFAVLTTVNTYAQIELGECDQPYNDKVQKQIDKALTSLNKKTRNDDRMARIYVNNILEMEPNNAHGLYLMGEIAIREKNITKTEAYFTRCLNVCPNYLAEVQFYLGIILLENGKKTKAEEYLEKYLNNPERDRVYDKEANAVLKEIRLQENLKANPVPFEPRPVVQVSTKDDEYLGHHIT